MKKLVLFLFLINGVAATLIFLDIRVMEAPLTTVKIDVIEITPNEALVVTNIDIKNPNPFPVITKNLRVTLLTKEGQEVTRLLIEGGSIPSRDRRTFKVTKSINFTDKIIITEITGIVGIKVLGFIQKTLPFCLNVVTSLEKIEEFTLPRISVTADFVKLFQEFAQIQTFLDIYNPNPFEIHVKNISISITNEKGEEVGNMSISDGVVTPGNSSIFRGKGEVGIEALNAKFIILDVKGEAGIKIIGIKKYKPFKIKSKIKLPEIDRILNPYIPTHAIIKGNYRVGFRKLIDETTFQIHNPNNISFVAQNITISLYRIDGEKEMFLAKCSLGGGIIRGKNVTSFKGELVIPLSKLRRRPDWLKVTLTADISLPRVNYWVKLGITGYQDMRLFR
jgi:LEA14-like dessication related protein